MKFLVMRLAAIFDALQRFYGIMAAVLWAFATFAIAFEVVMRYFLNRPQIWVAESVEYVILITTFLIASWVLKNERHVNVDIIPNMMKPGARALLNAVMSIVGAMVCLVMAWYGAHQTWYFLQQGILTRTALELAKWPFIGIIALGFFQLFIQFLRRAYGYLASHRLSREPQVAAR